MPMLRNERQALNDNRQLRDLLRGAATIEPLSRSEVEDQVQRMDAIPFERRDEVVEAVAEVARIAREMHRQQQLKAERQLAERMRGVPAETIGVHVPFYPNPVISRADELTVDLLRRWAIEDQLVPDPTFDPFPPAPGEQHDPENDPDTLASLIPRN